MMFPGMGGWMMAASGILLLLIVGVAVVTVLLAPRPRCGVPVSQDPRPRSCWISGTPEAKLMTTSTTVA